MADRIRGLERNRETQCESSRGGGGAGGVGERRLELAAQDLGQVLGQDHEHGEPSELAKCMCLCITTRAGIQGT